MRNDDTGELYAKYRFNEGDRFSIEFIHSVNKSPVRDIYEVIDGKIYVVETIYYAFGAGVQTELNEGETLSYGENNEMIISNINQELPYLCYRVGTVSDHMLMVNDEKAISLRELCGRNSPVLFSFE